MDEARCSRPQQGLIPDERHVLILEGNVLTPSNPQVTIRDTNCSELNHRLYLTE